ncbi:MAG: tRNA pseudouridine(13) synthase TruD [Myxococcota bacterium]
MRSPRLTARYPGSGGRLRRDPEDFEVEERLPYAAEGRGDHLFVLIEKRGLNTSAAALQVAEHLGIIQPGERLPPEAGWAGMKDRHAVARQWLSFPWREANPLPEPTTLSLEAGSVGVLAAHRHRHKLRKGHVQANRFRIRIRDVPPGGTERARAALARLRVTGMPNPFGPQRFGREGDNADRARAILAGKARRPRDRRLWSLLCSALQSEVFNRILAFRIESGLLTTAIRGDRMVKHVSGGQFAVDDPSVEQPRVDALEISPTGGLPGKRTPAVSELAAEIEAQARAEAQIDPALEARLGTGARRPLRLPLSPETEIRPLGDEAWELHVELPSGVYATALLDELVKPEGEVFDRSD